MIIYQSYASWCTCQLISKLEASLQFEVLWEFCFFFFYWSTLIASSDILVFRRHFLQCPQGLLNKHFEKLIQCDPRLYALSQELDIILKSPFFEPKISMFEDPDEYKCHPFDKLKDEYGSAIQNFQDSALACAGTSISAKSEIRESTGALSDISIGKIHSPSSGSSASHFYNSLSVL